MYHIAVLTNSETQEAFYIEQLSRFCFERGLFPKMDCYRGQELFFDVARVNAPTCTVIALPGVEGLNAVEHLRTLFPETRIIWCSDLDFSLHAFRLRVDYFLLEPITEEGFWITIRVYLRLISTSFFRVLLQWLFRYAFASWA